MTTVWFNNDGSGIAQSIEDPDFLIVGDYIPDWVMIPQECAERPGEKLKVTGHHIKICPICHKAPIRILELEHNFHVAECKPGCGFVFYKVS